MSVNETDPKYALRKPDEDVEVNRLNLQHRLICLTQGDRLYTSPVNSQVKSVLDLGCGTGIWAVDFAKLFPSAHVTGMDLTKPKTAAPSNVKFVEGDFEQDWPLGSFDFIYGRMLNVSVGDWPLFLSRCFEHLNPNGWIEFLDIAVPYGAEDSQASKSSSAFLRFGEAMFKGWEVLGRDFQAGSKYVQRLRDLGLQDVTETMLRWPLGPWGDTDEERRVGQLSLQNFKMLLPDFVPVLAHTMSQEEARKLVEDTFQDVEENGVARRYYEPIKVH
ncbi:MAG: hypothetical protein Q9174_005814, partial [Haloplaca sp. 1 TL-2023]